MNYLLDKKIKRKKFTKIILVIVVLFCLTYFRTDVFNGFSYVASAVFRPFMIAGNSVGEKVSSIGAIFHNRQTLTLENDNLKSQIALSQADRANYASVIDENNKLKEILGRKKDVNMILAGILSKPNQSLYDTLLIDAGTENGIVKGQRVFALGNVPIGYITEVYAKSSKVILYSNPGEKNEVVVSGKDSFMEAVGRGGGNFEITLPRDFVLPVGTEIDLPGVNPYILATVANILSDPRDSFQKALLVSPVNIQELKFVEVEK